MKTNNQQRKKDNTEAHNVVLSGETKSSQMKKINLGCKAEDMDTHSAENYNKLFKEMAHYKERCVNLMCELDDLQGAYDIAIKEINKLRRKLK